MRLIVNSCVLIFFLSLISCERTLDIKLSPGKKQLVIEGEFYQNGYPFVILSRSVGFFDKFDLSKAQFEKDALVSIKDITEGDSIRLREYVIDTVLNGNPFRYIFHSIDIGNPNHFNFLGQLNHQYKITILSKGETFESTTAIVPSVKADSIWAIPNPASKDGGKVLKVIWDDPDTSGNYVRYTTKVLRKDKSKGQSEEWLTNFGSVFDDAFTAGAKLTFDLDLGFTKGVNFRDSTSVSKFDLERNLYTGDTVIVRWSGIDYQTYQFWTTLEFSRNSTGNPFAAPTKVSSTFKNAIGLFGGYGAKYDTLIVQ